MKIVRIFGGLGNQMFQYALAVSLDARGEETRIDRSCMRGYPLHNGYELGRIFGAAIPQASWVEMLRVAYPLPHYRLWQLGKRLLPRRRTMVVEGEDMTFNPAVLDAGGNALLEGYWQTERYFADCRREVLDAFAFPPFDSESANAHLAKRIRANKSVAVHVRRGDYLRISNTSGICTDEYYDKAITMMSEGHRPDLFVFFSDDIEWCKNRFSHLPGGAQSVFADWNHGADSFRDMQLMSLCSHNIIANSSFSWWGAWLNANPDKTVIAPSRWMNGPGWPDIIPESWIKI